MDQEGTLYLCHICVIYLFVTVVLNQCHICFIVTYLCHMCAIVVSSLCQISVRLTTHLCIVCCFDCVFNSRYGKAAISKERKKSARYEDVEDFPESCANDQVDAVVDYLINQGADINASDKYGMLYVLSCNKITRPEINSPAEIEMAFYQIIATRG